TRRKGISSGTDTCVRRKSGVCSVRGQASEPEVEYSACALRSHTRKRSPSAAVCSDSTGSGAAVVLRLRAGCDSESGSGRLLS
ncbi:hypothetical protein NDU88_000985, partial [Pleurodeles waltl]